MEELRIIQQKLKAPKGQYNSFGKYAYRSCEDIFAAAKPLAHENECSLFTSEEVVLIGDRIYIKSTATLTNKDGVSVSASSYAREEETKKGMDAAQITGATISYARKFALGGLFGIDDTKDADALNVNRAYTSNNNTLKKLKAEIENAQTVQSLTEIYKANPEMHSDQSFMTALTERKKAVENAMKKQ